MKTKQSSVWVYIYGKTTMKSQEMLWKVQR